MTHPIFIDTGYILALANTADKYHERAYAASLLVQPPFVTTEAVLTEIGNAFSRIRWRALLRSSMICARIPTLKPYQLTLRLLTAP